MLKLKVVIGGFAMIGILVVLPHFVARRVRVTNLQGDEIPSIFYGAPSNARLAKLYKSLTVSPSGSPPCTAQRAVFRDTALEVHLLRVQTDTCRSHYVLCEERFCGSCLGGNESWCYSDATEEPYSKGYELDHVGCVGHCTEEHECWNN